MAAGALSFFSSQAVLAETAADTLEKKILSAADDRRIVNNLGQAFQKEPSGEFLLAPPNGDIRFAVLIYNIDILPDKAVFSAGMAFRDSRSNQLVAFNTNQVEFSYHHGITGSITLFLLDTVSIHIGKMVDISFYPGTGQTFATMDCSGISGFGCAGLLGFNPKYLIPCDDTGKVLNGKLQSEFRFFCKKWNDILASISINPFQIRGLKDYVFSLQNFTLDWSETSSHPEFQLPAGYRNSGAYLSGNEAWEGIFFSSGTIRFPKYFKSENGKPISIRFGKFIIDENGISGNITADHILPYGAGSLGGWKFGIESFSVDLYMNRLKSVTFKGEMGLPILPDTSHLGYFASLSSENLYLFSVSVRNQIRIPAMNAAEVVLDENSYITARINNGNVTLEAGLTGIMTIVTFEDTEGNKPKADLPGISFRNLHISNKKPKFGIEYLGLSNGGGTISGFPVQVDQLSFSSIDNHHEINIGIALNLTEYAVARGSFKIRAKSSTINGIDRLIHERTVLSSLFVDFEKSGMQIQGELTMFRQDLNYGNGFRGQVNFGLNDPQIKLNAVALFGSINNFRYWYVDADILFPTPGLLLGPGINANGFAGGAWYHLLPWDGKSKLANPELGKTASGAVLVPSTEAGLGLRAGVWLNGGSSKSYLAKSVLEMHFFKTEGINKILFYGELQVMPKSVETTSEQLKLTNKSKLSTGNSWLNYCSTFMPASEISGPFMLEFDFRNKSFSANAALYVYKAAANTLNGGHANSMAGEAGMYFSKSDWFIYAGQPQKTLAVLLSLGKLANLKTESYFIAGTKLPNAPPAPAEITTFLGPLTLGTNRNLDEIGSGKGFAMGWSLTAQASAGGNDKKVSVYANLLAKCALDVNMQSFQPALTCEETGRIAGINGWYANGALYAFLQGKLGASAGGFKVDVMTFTGASAMEFNAPGPTGAKAKTKIEFNLGGIFKYRGFMTITLGESCTPVKSVLPDGEILYSTSPVTGEKDVSPLTIYTMKFNVPVNQWLTVNQKTIKFQLTEIEILQNSTIYKGDFKLLHDGLSAEFNLNKPLKPNTSTEWKFGFTVYELIGSSIVPVYFQGTQLTESHSVIFNTAELPDYIPIENVKSSWPFANQVNFYSDEVPNGAIELEVAQDNVFNVQGYKVIARFSPAAGGAGAEAEVNYNKGAASFKLPALQPSTVYKLRLLRVPMHYSISSTNSAVSWQSITAKGPGVASGFAAKSNGVASGNLNTMNAASQTVQKQLLEFNFRTSAYKLFQQKISDMQQTSYPNATELNPNIKYVNNNNEYFDAFEMKGEERLISFSGGWKICPWALAEATRKIYPAMKYPGAVNWLSRDTSEFGLFPRRAVKIDQENVLNEVLSNHFGTNNYSFRSIELSACYFLPSIVKQDFEDIRNQLLINYYRSHPNALMMINDYLRNYSTGASPGPTGPISSSLMLSAPAGFTSGPPAVAVSGSGPSASITPPAVNRLLNLKFPDLYVPGNYPFEVSLSVPVVSLKRIGILKMEYK